MRRSHLFIAACALVAFAAPAAAKSITLAGETNLRKAPGTTSEVVTLIPKGEKVEVGECDAGWCQLTWNGNEGYAIQRNLVAAAPKRPAATARRAPPNTVYDDEEDEVAYAPGPGYGPRVYYDEPAYVYAPRPYYRPYGYGYYGYGYGPGWRRW